MVYVTLLATGIVQWDVRNKFHITKKKSNQVSDKRYFFYMKSKFTKNNDIKSLNGISVEDEACSYFILDFLSL